MTTPSKKLNAFLYANRRAAVRTAAEMEADRILETDRDLSPETRALLEQARAALKLARTA